MTPEQISRAKEILRKEFDFYEETERGKLARIALSAIEALEKRNAELEADRDSARRERDDAKNEADAARADVDLMANETVYHGNSVSHWYAKAIAYKDAFQKRDEALAQLRLVEAETIAKAVPSDHCVVPRSLVVDVMAYGEDGKVLEPWMVDKLESALLGAFPSPPLEQGRKGEQIAAQPKCKACKDERKLMRAEFGKGMVTVDCPYCATPSSVEGRKCVCAIDETETVCDKTMEQVARTGTSLLCPYCNHSGACHEVATPGTNAGEKQP